MKIGFICSNAHPISSQTKKGTEIFVNMLFSSLPKEDYVSYTAFASGDSEIPFEIISVDTKASVKDPSITSEKKVIFELALISKAFQMQQEFDLYHVNIGNGDIVMPFLPFVTKPVVITVHNTLEGEYNKKFFDLFKTIPNVYFVSASEAQRKLLPTLPYIATIRHGIELNIFQFSQSSLDQVFWAGRGIPVKGLDVAMLVTHATKRKTKAAVIRKEEQKEWLEKTISESKEACGDNLDIVFDVNRSDLISEYQKSKLFLYTGLYEEVFGLVLLEAMACGTPIVGFARGATPEIIEDGVTGFLVNPSDKDLRGDFLIKQTGVTGLIEGVEKIFAMDNSEYSQMRAACRKHVEKYFTADRMAKDYLALYKKIVSSSVNKTQ